MVNLFQVPTQKTKRAHRVLLRKEKKPPAHFKVRIRAVPAGLNPKVHLVRLILEIHLHVIRAALAVVENRY